ncbi:MAG TPA: malto-oligosyltrehalose trehalohydrolase [Candidatus Acidoferrales bacterium]
MDLPAQIDDHMIGAIPRADGTWHFSVWAPKRESVAVHVLGDNEQTVGMEQGDCGYHHTTLRNLATGDRYFYKLDDEHERPDPASRFQPDGVHGPSQLVDLRMFQWSDSNWKGRRLGSSIFYELHVGTYTREGTFEAIIERLPELVDLGVTTIELMPVAQFPGSRNWGYDGVYLFAPQNTYGGPYALQRLVDAAHAHGLAMALDVVYNHLGPEGNYLAEYGPYFTEKYRTPWGKALNFDDAQSDSVRRFFIQNALYWLKEFHFDALRLDAIHGIFDFSARHVLKELQDEVRALATRLGREIHLIAESDLNDARILLPHEKGGYDLPAQWSDDFHHSLHTLLTKEQTGYYGDFGRVHHLATVIKDGWFYRGQFSKYRQRRHGNFAVGISQSHFVVCSQNHDQVGNRALGERLSQLVSFEGEKLAAGVTLLSPFVPLLFMGEEYGETSPFLYFTSHGDKDLIEAVRRGRREEFASFGWKHETPDPQAPATFETSALKHELEEQEPHRTLRTFYKKLIELRKVCHFGPDSNVETIADDDHECLWLLWTSDPSALAAVFFFGRTELETEGTLPPGRWLIKLSSAESKWLGPGRKLREGVVLNPTSRITLSPQSFLLLERAAMERI